MMYSQGRLPLFFRTAVAAATLVLFAGMDGHETPYPTDYFGSPVDFPIVLAGNFGEMRSNHFHSGLDIKTQEKEGLPILAAADGYVSRIKVSPYGFGNALYLHHPNGYTTVYAHLSGFREDISEHVLNMQYQRRRFSIDTYPKSGTFLVKKGDVIGLSGNSGSSFGPHLHFEIRESAGQRPLNPLLFGFAVSDQQPPRIFRVKLYPQDSDSHVRVKRSDGSEELASRESPAVLKVELRNGKYELDRVAALAGSGRVGVAIQTHDYHDGSRNRLGAFEIRLDADGSAIYRSEIRSFRFRDTRYINAHIDYAERQSSRRWFQRSFLLPGNKLDIYQTINDGYVVLEPGDRHELSYSVKDAFGNVSLLGFSIAGEAKQSVSRAASDSETDYLVDVADINTSVAVQRSDFKADFSKGSFYAPFVLRYRSDDAPAGALSRLHVLHDVGTPIHHRYAISISADVPRALADKVVIAGLDKKDKPFSIGGEYKNGFAKGRTRSFGRFFVTADTVAPQIDALNVTDGADASALTSLRFKIKDDLSGLESFSAYVDGEWVLLTHDAKKDVVEHIFDGRIAEGPHDLVLTASDKRGNQTVYQVSFTR